MTIVYIIETMLASPGDEPEVNRPESPPAQKQTDELSLETKKSFDLALRTLRENRAQLRSGVFRASGKKSDGIKGNAKSPFYSGPVKIFCAFDDEQKLFRFDRIEPQPFWDPRDDSVKIIERRLQYVRTPQQALYSENAWIEDEPGRVVICKPEYKPANGVLPFDVRILGIGWGGDLSNHNSLEEVLTKNFKGAKIVYFFETEKGIIRINTPYTDRFGNTVEHIYWLDKTQAFAPIRFEMSFSSLPDNLKPLLSEPMETHHAEWTLSNGIQVPSKFSFTYRAPQITNRRITTYDLDFDWEGANGTISPDLFKISGLELPLGTPIFDERSGKRIEIDVVQ